jgi:hypothetical protein
MICGKRLSIGEAERRVRSLEEVKSALGLEDTIGALVIGITSNSIQDDFDIKTIEERGVLVRFVDLD